MHTRVSVEFRRAPPAAEIADDRVHGFEFAVRGEARSRSWRIVIAGIIANSALSSSTRSATWYASRMTRRRLATLVAVLCWSYLAWVVGNFVSLMNPERNPSTWVTFTLTWTAMSTYIMVVSIGVIATRIAVRRQTPTQ